MAATQQAAVLPKKGHSISDGKNVSIKLDVVPSENHNLTSTVTDHPVEEGSNISDHSRPDPDVVSLECLITNTPLPPDSVDNNKAQKAYEDLRKLRDLGSLVTVVTTLGRYDSMVIQSVSVTRDSPTYNALAFTVVFKKIHVVENKLTSRKVSKQKNVASKVDTGSQTPLGPEQQDDTDLLKLIGAGK